MSVCAQESTGECVHRGEQIMFGHCKESNGRRPIFSSNGAAQRLYTHWTLFMQPLPCTYCMYYMYYMYCMYCMYCMLLRQSSV